ncbi:MAG: AI-2E family transporter [Candidatus Sumerlaeaceae bacterium]|nr:AI-2E family transporter [Candidatus Sumerlaeaceae bacterium]
MRLALLVLVWILNVGGFLALAHFARPAITLILTILSPFIVALIVAYIFNPLVEALQRGHRLSRVGAVAVTYALLVALATAFLSVVLPVLYVQVRSGVAALTEHLPRAAEQIITRLNIEVPKEDLQSLRQMLQDPNALDTIAQRAGPAARLITAQTAKAVGLAASAFAYGVSLMVGLTGLFVFIVLISFYFLLDYARIGAVSRVLIPAAYREQVFRIWGEIDRALGGYLRGQFTICIIIGVMYTVGLTMLGMRSYAILIGCLAGLGNLIPYFGPIVGGVPAALWVIFSDLYPTAGAKIAGLMGIAVFTGVIQALDGFVFQPRIVGRSANIHPLLVLLALVVGAQFGLGGLIVAVPLAIVARVLVLELLWRPLKSTYDRSYSIAAGDGNPPSGAQP